MAKKIELALVYGAAYHFAFISRDKSQIATQLGLCERTIYRYAKLPQWHHALDVFGYTGDRAFLKKKTRNPARENPDFEWVESVYGEAWFFGVKTHQLASFTARETGVSQALIRKWARKNNWVEKLEAAYNE